MTRPPTCNPPGPVGLAQENMTETNPERKTAEGGACLPMPNLA